MEKGGVQELLELFLQTNDLQRLMEGAAKALGNPLVVCDTSYHIIARSDSRGVRDKSWIAGMKRGFWSYELVSTINRLDLDYHGREPRTRILTSINSASSARRRVGTLCIDGSHLGYYLMLEEHTPFEQVSEHTCRQVAAILAKCMCTDRSLQPSGGSGEGERILLDLLGSGFESRRLFSERVAKHELSRSGSYRVLCIPMEQEQANRTSPEARDIRSLIGRCLPLSWQVSFQDSIVILADLSEGLYRDKEMPERFEGLLAQRGLQAGQSDGFSDVFHLKRHYQQAHAAASLGRAFGDSRQVIPYEDYKLYNLFLNVREEDLFGQYSSQIIRQIYEFDRENGTEYLETVYHYLASQCSVQQAARRLYVHRNTVAYRIEKVKELFGMRFDDSEKNYLNLTSCLLRRYCDCIEKK